MFVREDDTRVGVLDLRGEAGDAGVAELAADVGPFLLLGDLFGCIGKIGV